MSCGPAKALLELADQVDALNNQIDAAIMDIPGMGDLAGLKDKVEGTAQGLMDKLNEAMPTIKIPTGDFKDLPLQDQFKQIAGLMALGYLQKDNIENQLDVMKNKYKDFDIDIETLATDLRKGAIDLDNLCKMIPNVQTDGINLEVKGVPTSFPDIDPVTVIRQGKLPPLPKANKVFIDPQITKKAQTDEFLNIELPSFDF
tara:strand:+ start:2627 stop:3229 length:603 start_codon:yes stop_codon:yes gene_type:complete